MAIFHLKELMFEKVKDFALLIFVVLTISLGFIVTSNYIRHINDIPASSAVPDTVTITAIRTDTVKVHDTIYIPRVSKVYIPTKEYINIQLTKYDSLSIIESYFSSVVTIDTLVNDSLLFFVLSDSIHMNNIKSRKLNYSVLERTKTVSTTIYMPPVKHPDFYVGVGPGVYGDNNDFDVSVYGGFRPTESRVLYLVKYGVFAKSKEFGLLYKF
jgi:hypothetical protein